MTSDSTQAADALHEPDCLDLAERLNRECHCVSLDRERLRRALARHESGADVYRLIATERPNLFSASAVFVGGNQLRSMARVIAAVERVIALPGYREHVLSYAPDSARHQPRAAGVFLGYDFHLGSSAAGPGPKLIEINTNAGGALLNALLGQAHQACCGRLAAVLTGTAAGTAPEQMFLAMFETEWRLARGDDALQGIAIVDADPAAQYLYPEFVLFQRLFRRHGYEAVICDPRELTFDGERLHHQGRRIDLVYNRLTDFALAGPDCAALRAAYLADAAVVTPHPYAHALYADKRNLIALTDRDLLQRFGADAQTVETLLTGIPRTLPVSKDDAASFWSTRRNWFFKSAAGYGSKGAYRGDKLTRRVFEGILGGNYIAQAMASPSERSVVVAAEAVPLKLDLRNYVYRGEVQLVAARLYQGQTTNFRTPGGGFAPVLTVQC